MIAAPQNTDNPGSRARRGVRHSLREARLPNPGHVCRWPSGRWRLVDRHPELCAFLSEFSVPQPPRAGQPAAPHTKTGVFETLKDDGDVLWGRVDAAGESWFLKARRLQRARRLWASTFKTSPTQKEWQRTWWLRQHGIATPEPLAVGELRRWRRLHVCYYVSRWLGGAMPLSQFYAEREAALAPQEFRELRRRLIERLGSLFAALHRAGSYHRQYHADNILVQTCGDGATWDLLPVDLKHLSVPRRLDGAHWAWSVYLASWWLPAPYVDWFGGGGDLQDFIRGYLRQPPVVSGVLSLRRAARGSQPEGQPGSLTDAPDVESVAREFQGVLPEKPLRCAPRSQEFAQYSRERGLFIS